MGAGGSGCLRFCLLRKEQAFGIGLRVWATEDDGPPKYVSEDGPTPEDHLLFMPEQMFAKKTRSKAGSKARAMAGRAVWWRGASRPIVGDGLPALYSLRGRAVGAALLLTLFCCVLSTSAAFHTSQHCEHKAASVGLHIAYGPSWTHIPDSDHAFCLLCVSNHCC